MKGGRALLVTIVIDESLVEVAGGVTGGRAAIEDVEPLVGVAGGVTGGRVAIEDVEPLVGVAGGVTEGRAVIENVVSVEPSLKERGVLVSIRPIATDSLIICDERVLLLV